jgi:hypothetical protein
VRQIKVVYRAVFQQLKSVAMICRAPVNVEVAQSGGQWISRSPDTGVSFHFTECQSAEAAKKEAESRFITMLSDEWAIFGKPPEGPAALRLLEPEEYTMKDGKVYWLELNDFTHIVDPKRELTSIGRINDKAKIWPAACGESPSVKQIISLKANIEPSCPKCAEVYRERYAAK